VNDSCRCAKLTGGLSFAKVVAKERWFERNIKASAMVKMKKTSAEIAAPNRAAEPLLIELSPAANTNLKTLQLLSLDRQGRQPSPSQIIEKLINAAAVNGPDAPYPG
jgi:hypothetical protein